MNKTFSDFGILGVDLSKQGNQYVSCPECSASRKKKNVKCLSVLVSEGVWVCHHCGYSGTLKAGKKHQSRPYQKTKEYFRPPEQSKTDFDKDVIDAFGKRGITQQVLERRKIFRTSIYFPQTEKEEMAVCFPYFREGKLINIKYRAPGKLFRMVANAERIFYGLDDVAGDFVIITEGEFDAISLEVAGFNSVLSVPDGAPNPKAKSYEKKFDFLEPALEVLEGKTIIIAVDNDDPGLKLQEELARRLGKERCKLVEWPEGCKDANDVLVKHGATKLKECIENAQPYPVKGIFDLKDVEDKLDYLYKFGSKSGEYPGWNNLSEHYSIRAGEWTIVTGIPGHGKTSFIDSMMVKLAKDIGWLFAIYSPENQPIERHISKLMELRSGLPFGKGRKERMPVEIYESAKKFIQESFSFILPDEEDDQTLDSILRLAKVLVCRKGIKGLVIDPWNEIDHSRHKESTETEYISRSLSKIRSFARNNGVHVWLIAHPTKLMKNKKGKYPVPTPYDVAGSAHFRNKADNALCVWRDLNNKEQKDIVQIHIQKIRHRENGKLGMIELLYERTSGDFVEIGF
jgi:twinkle protein